MTPARHLALDAVINAIIYRQYGLDYSSMMAGYYADVTDLRKLLRPMSLEEQDFYDDYWDEDYPLPQWVGAWSALYSGHLIADDVEEFPGLREIRVRQLLAQDIGVGRDGSQRGLEFVAGQGHEPPLQAVETGHGQIFLVRLP